MGPELPRPRPLQPVLPPAGEGRPRQGDHLEGHGDPGHVHAEADATRDAKPTTRFSTEIPAFADNDALSQLLAGEGRGRERRAARHAARRGGRACCSASARRSSSSACSFWLMRRAGSVQNVLGSFGRSRARRYQPSGDRVTFADVAGIDEAKAELTRGRRLPAPPREVPAARRPDPARRAALRAARHRQDAARARGRRRGGRAVLLDGGVRVRRGDRRRRRLARARPVRAGEGGRAGDRLHRRARRDRPLAHVGRRRASAAATTSASRR